MYDYIASFVRRVSIPRAADWYTGVEVEWGRECFAAGKPLNVAVVSAFLPPCPSCCCIAFCWPYRKVRILLERGGLTAGDFIAVVSCIRE